MLNDKDRESLNGEGFSGGASKSGASGEYSHIQLFNPAGSGKRLIVDLAVVSYHNGSSPATCFLRNYNTILTDSVTIDTKKNGAGSGVGILKTQSSATNLGIAKLEKIVPIDGNVATQFIERGPHILNEGEGLVLILGVVFKFHLANFEWREVNV